VNALYGGVDSTLVAHLARRECVALGLADSHDLQQARHAADTLGLSCTYVTITPAEIAAALPIVIEAIPIKDPVNTSIALAQYFVARFAGEQGYQRILSGQGADELFGGYSRYLETPTLAEDLERDFIGLELQADREEDRSLLDNDCSLIRTIPGCWISCTEYSYTSIDIFKVSIDIF